ARGRAVHVHRARTALRSAAPVLRALEVESVPQHPEERRVRRDVHRDELAVDLERDGHAKAPASRVLESQTGAAPALAVNYGAGTSAHPPPWFAGGLPPACTPPLDAVILRTPAGGVQRVAGSARTPARHGTAHRHAGGAALHSGLAARAPAGLFGRWARRVENRAATRVLHR